jgi:hypothetical protein
MGRLRSNKLLWVVAVLLTSMFAGCGKHPAVVGPSLPARINLNPSINTSLQLGGTLTFAASATSATNGNIATTFTYSSSDNSILNMAPNGVACAGTWNATYTACTPGGTGVVQVTASALGLSSVPTFVFVHAPIDSVSVTGILIDGVPIQEPCLSQGQTMTVEAHAFSQGSDITASVGPFTWSANNAGVVKLTPLVNIAFNFATNQATATGVTPGLTQIYATAGGVSSSSFQQPQYANSQGIQAPVFDFFETCPIQNIVLEVGRAGSQQSNFIATKGASETIVATLTDVMGNSSLINTIGSPILSAIPLTWTSSQPALVGTSGACKQSCGLTISSPGAAAITASCTPPSCNIGFPLAPAVLSTPACAQFLQARFPNITSCEQFIPLPVYSSPLPPLSGQTTPSIPAISGLVTGVTATSSALATSLGCAPASPINCITATYNVTTTGGSPGAASLMPVSPNSLLFDSAGDRAYMGSDFGAQQISSSAIGTTNNAFSSVGAITGKVLAISPSGSVAIFSDTLHQPNQVYVYNSAATLISQRITALNISGATAAGFSSDGMKAFIFGFDASGNPTLYIDSALQGLMQSCNVTGPPGCQDSLPAQTTVNSIAFSTNGAFAYVVEPTLGGVGPAVSVYNTCNNQIAADAISGKTYIPLAAAPIKFKVLPDGLHFVALEAGGGIQYITATVTGIPAASLTQPANSVCPMTVSHTVQTINLDEGTLQPINFFTSADGTLLYVVASNRPSILAYDFNTSSVNGILLSGNATPISADISADASYLFVAGSDGLLHRVSTGVGGSDQTPLLFPNLPNIFNPFCTNGQPPCTLSLVVARP